MQHLLSISERLNSIGYGFPVHVLNLLYNDIQNVRPLIKGNLLKNTFAIITLQMHYIDLIKNFEISSH